MRAGDCSRPESAESSVENPPGLVLGGDVGVGDVCPKRWERFAKCAGDLPCVSYGVISNSATAQRNSEYKMAFKSVWVLILRRVSASGKTKWETEP